MVTPLEQAWSLLKEEPFDLRETLEANTDPNDPMGQALAQARAKGPEEYIQWDRGQQKLPPSLTAGSAQSMPTLPKPESKLPPVNNDVNSPTWGDDFRAQLEARGQKLPPR